jgi:hypothetical protein
VRIFIVKKTVVAAKEAHFLIMGFIKKRIPHISNPKNV